MKNGEPTMRGPNNPKLFGETMPGGELGYVGFVRNFRCVIWIENPPRAPFKVEKRRWCASVDFKNYTFEMITNDSATPQEAATKIEEWFVEFAKEILVKDRS